MEAEKTRISSVASANTVSNSSSIGDEAKPEAPLVLLNPD